MGFDLTIIFNSNLKVQKVVPKNGLLRTLVWKIPKLLKNLGTKYCTPKH